MEMSASEISGWIEYFSIYPFTQDREDMRVALLAERVTNTMGALLAQNAGKKSYSPIKIEKFLPTYLETKSEPETLEQQNAKFHAFAETLRRAKKKKVK